VIVTLDILISGSRYVSWLPSFSVEVTHTQLLRSDQPQPAQTSQLDAMARQVSRVFFLFMCLHDLRMWCREHISFDYTYIL